MLHRPALALSLVLASAALARADGIAAVDTGEPPLPAIGARIDPGLVLTDVRYLRRRLDDLGPRKATVLVAVTTTCPIARRYMPRLIELEAAYRERGVRFALLGVGRGDLPLDLAAAALELGVSFPALVDRDGSAARALGVTRSPEAVVIDGDGKLAYRGRIDDQHRIGGSRPAPTREDLREALDDVLAGEPVRVSEAPAEGCRVSGPEPVVASGPAPTWAEVAPILERRCVACHHRDGGAPFALDTFEDAWGLADQVADVVAEGRMPPWHASPKHGTFANDPRLSPDERRLIAGWVAAGAPLGDPAKAPTIHAPAPTGGWRIGPPDVVIATVEPAKLPASGDVPYQYELLPYVFEEDTWVSGLEIRATNPKVMHHCNLAYLLPGGAKDSYFVSGQVPGGEAMQLDPGLGFLFPKGATLVLQVHYVTTGQPETSTIEVGMRWPRDPVTKRVHHLVVHRSDLAIPPQDRFHEVRASKTLDADATVLAMFTHMHLRGRDMTFIAHRPGGADETLMAVPAYDFDWQRTYHVAPGALRLPKGTRIECVGHYDNSSWNPFNPDPTATIGDGPQTRDEMFFGFFFYTEDAEHLDLQVDPATGHAVAR